MGRLGGNPGVPEQQTPKSFKWLHPPALPHEPCEHMVAETSLPTHDKLDSQMWPVPVCVCVWMGGCVYVHMYACT